MRSSLDRWIMETEGLAEVDRESIQALQLQKLNAQLLRVTRRGGFYKNYPAHIESLAELRELPFTTADDIRNHGNRLLLVSQRDIARVSSDTTSGTTGSGKRIYYTEGDRARTVSFFVQGIAQFAGAGNRVGIAIPFSGSGGLGELIAQAVEQLCAEPVEIGVGKSYREMLDIIIDRQPNLWIGMPVPLLSLLRAAAQFGVDWILDEALLSADTVSPVILQEIRHLCGPRLWSHYGSRECGLGGAVSCTENAGLHVRENDLLLEVIDAEGRVMPEGGLGELVLTTLHSEAMPLIRYRTGDRGRMLTGSCACGSNVLRITDVERIGGESITTLDDTLFRLPEVVDYRAIRKGGGLHLDVQISAVISPEVIRHRVGKVFPLEKISVKVHNNGRDNKSMIRGKRKIDG